MASGSGAVGLACERGWRGSVSHLYVQHGAVGTDGIDGAGDEEGWDREPRSLPNLANGTLVRSYPYGKREREAVGLRLRSGSRVQATSLLIKHFGGGAINGGSRAALPFVEGASAITRSRFHLNGFRQLNYWPWQLEDATIEFADRSPELSDVRWFANPDPRPEEDSHALKRGDPVSRQPEGLGGLDAEQPKAPNYIGAFGEKENWLEEWTFFGPESDYDPRRVDDSEN